PAARSGECGGAAAARGARLGPGALGAAGGRRTGGRARRGARGVNGGRAAPVAMRLAAALVGGLAATWRYRVRGWEHVEAARRSGRPVIYILWHSRILPLLYHRRGEGMALLISRHRDGGYLAALSERWGYRVVRGSSRRGGEVGLLGLVRHLRGGGEVALTPDGPRGPAERMKPGALVAAQQAGALVIAAGARAARAWRSRSRPGRTGCARRWERPSARSAPCPTAGSCGERRARGALGVGRGARRAPGAPAPAPARRRLLGGAARARGASRARARAPRAAGDRRGQPVGGRDREDAARGVGGGVLRGAGVHAGDPAARLRRRRAAGAPAARARRGGGGESRSGGWGGGGAGPGRAGAGPRRRLPAGRRGAGPEHLRGERRESRRLVLGAPRGTVAGGVGGAGARAARSDHPQAGHGRGGGAACGPRGAAMAGAAGGDCPAR